jgi:DNA (cytosine-5)-methyltransferase 1
MLAKERDRLGPTLKVRALKARNPTKDGPIFVDLFAGIGGFHQALHDLGGECLFASEIDTEAIATYKANFPGTLIHGDIREIDHENLPDFDFLCAGFPCQPFSKGGGRRGFEDTRGTLFFDICEMLEAKKPSFVLLENVPNLVGHDGGNTYATIIRSLQELGYKTPSRPLLLSPHLFGVPVHRPRLYIPAIREDLIEIESIDLTFAPTLSRKSIYSLLDGAKKNSRYKISLYEERVLDMWNEFYKGIDLTVIGFPVWAEEFGATYSHKKLPAWKREFIRKNRELYERNKKFLDRWLKKHQNLSWCRPSHRKFEWQAGDTHKDIYECLIQFRPSGVRARKADKFSTLVAMNHSQVVGRYKRRLSPDETKRLQSFPENFKMHPSDRLALKQLGNAVNVDVVKAVAKKMLALAKV